MPVLACPKCLSTLITKIKGDEITISSKKYMCNSQNCNNDYFNPIIFNNIEELKKERLKRKNKNEEQQYSSKEEYESEIQLSIYKENNND